MEQLLVQLRLQEADVGVRLHQRLHSLLRGVEDVLVGALEVLGDLGAGGRVQVDLWTSEKAVRRLIPQRQTK